MDQKSPVEIVKLPPGLRCAITAYVVSDSTGLEAAVELGAAIQIRPSSFGGFVAAACKVLNDAVGIADARPMTADEVAEYLDRQREDDAP